MGNRLLFDRITFAMLAGIAIVFATVPDHNALAASSSALSEEAVPLITEQEVLERKAVRSNGSVHKKISTPSAKGHRGAKPNAPDAHHSSALSEAPAPLLTEDDIPERAALPIEEGDKFLQSGNLTPGITLPTGAIWQPALWMFGDFRSTAGHFDNGVAENRQFFSNRLDIFFNLKLSPTERVLLGVSPLSRKRRDHTGVLNRPSTGTNFVDGFNPKIETIFFEGEFGEIFPNLDLNDEKQLDIGFSIGRQPVFFQEGMMINDSIDAFAITRDTIVIPGLTPDLRITGMFGFNEVGRDNNSNDDSAFLLGLFSEMDLRKSTVNIDAAYVFSDSSGGGDGLFLGASAIQRIGHYNTAFRVNASIATQNSGPEMDDGVLLFSEVSRTVTGSENIVYADAFWGIGNYSSAARDRNVGGPLGRTGILFAAPLASLSGPPLSNRADKVVGAAIGYQMFFNHENTQLTLELGGRKDTNRIGAGAVAFGGQLLHALDNRTSLQIDAFISGNEHRRVGTGLRAEVRTRF